MMKIDGRVLKDSLELRCIKCDLDSAVLIVRSLFLPEQSMICWCCLHQG